MRSKPIYCSKIAQKGKTCSRFLKLQKVAQNDKFCSNVAEHTRDRRSFGVSWLLEKIIPIKTCFATREEKSHDQLYRDFAVASSPIPSLRLSVNSLRSPDLH